MAVVEPHKGREAVTHFQTIRRGRQVNGRPAALVLCTLQTGRTHQIRVHMRHLGFPLIGDPMYGRRGDLSEIGRQALHAWCLGMRHPLDSRAVTWTAPIPADLSALLERCGIDPAFASELEA
jgi:23S rRNA pseudouridine1911/1915/1917 synthase